MEKGIEKLLSTFRKRLDVTRMRGITKRLKKVFYPHSRFKLGTSTRDHGTRIHRQLYHYIECKRSGTCKCHVKTRTYHKSVKFALEFLLKKDLIPVAAEVPVFHKSHVLGTALDMVCRQGPDKHAVISVKTGECLEYPPDAFMKPPLDTIPLTPKNVNQLQSMAEIELLRQDGIKVADYFILYINERLGIRMEKLDEWALDPRNQRKVLDAILAYKTPRKKPKPRLTKPLKLPKISKPKKPISKPKKPVSNPKKPVSKPKTPISKPKPKIPKKPTSKKEKKPSQTIINVNL